MRTHFWLFTEVVRKIPGEVTRWANESPKGQDNGSGTPSVLAAPDADKIFRSTAQLWFEITVRHEHR